MGTVALGLMRRFGGRWWIPGSVGVVLGAAVITWLAPVVLAPLFNKFDPLEPGQARDDVIELADRAGVDVGEVYRVDASRRTTAINAYVNGLGPSKRVVLYDTLIDDLDRGERRSVIAHELGHVEGKDIPRGLLFVAIATPLGLIFATGLARAVARPGAEPGAPTFLPAFALAIAVTSFAIGVAGNQLSGSRGARRHLLAGAHRRPEGLIELQQQLAERNISDPDPPVSTASCSGPTRPRSSGSGPPSPGSGRAPLNVTVIAVGKVKAPFEEADGHYRKLLRRHQPVDVIEVRDEANIEGRIPTRAHVIALDRGGRAMDSRAWSQWLSERRIDARDLCFLIGGAEGLTSGVIALADERLSFGPQTMAHQLARVVLLEQLFRAAKILAGERYHH